MIRVQFSWIFGVIVGIEIADKWECEEMEIAWGISFFLGILQITICYSYPDDINEKPA